MWGHYQDSDLQREMAERGRISDQLLSVASGIKVDVAERGPFVRLVINRVGEQPLLAKPLLLADPNIASYITQVRAKLLERDCENNIPEYGQLWLSPFSSPSTILLSLFDRARIISIFKRLRERGRISADGWALQSVGRAEQCGLSYQGIHGMMETTKDGRKPLPSDRHGLEWEK